jgi:ubiquinone/menaquinone biosynthesis C-methylase UbiE
MVRQADDALRASALDGQVEVRVMDAERLEFAADSFDVVLCSFGGFFFPRPERAAEEFVRVVVPGGLVGVSSWSTRMITGAGTTSCWAASTCPTGR